MPKQKFVIADKATDKPLGLLEMASVSHFEISHPDNELGK